MTTQPEVRRSNVRRAIANIAPYSGPDDPEYLAKRLGRPIESIIKLDANENPYGASPLVQEALSTFTGYSVYPDADSFRLDDETTGALIDLTDPTGGATHALSYVAAVKSFNPTTMVVDSTSDEIYPPGPGREIAERTCMICHGENFLSTQPANNTAAQIEHVVGTLS